MTQPLALVLYERLLPGSQLVNRLQDLRYRVQTISEPTRLVESAEQAKPMIVLADLEPNGNQVCDALANLKKNSNTNHLPVIAFGAEADANIQTAARNSGATLIVGETALLSHLPLFLERALQVD